MLPTSWRTTLKLASATALLLEAGTLAVHAQEVASNPALKPFPVTSLPQARAAVTRGGGLAGEAAVQALGRNLGAVADWYGKKPAELRSLLRKDKSLRVDATGRLYYLESAPVLPKAAPPLQKSLIDPTMPPLSQTFTLHSKPGAPRKIVLNFQGATITGTYLNQAQGRASIVAPPFDVEGGPATFTDGERTRIIQIWRSVAEDYAPYDVDVTTEVSSANKADPASYATVVITTQAAIGGSSPGYAYTSTYGNLAYDPAMVAYDTFQGQPKYVAEAVSHEMGHRLGLDHDGQGSNAYFAGQGSGVMRWAPIMGNSYTASVTQFSKGEYAGANNKQDDFQSMARFLPYRQDDAGNIMAEAPTFPATRANGVASGRIEGVIETQSDKDLYAIAAGAGPFSATVSPAALNPDADLVLTLLDDAGRVLASANPPLALGATLTASIPKAGTYFMQVSAAGYGSAYNTGYSDYGSRGNYGLTASYPAAATAAPKAVITSVSSGVVPATINFDGRGSKDDGSVVSYAWSLNDGAPGSAGTASQAQITFTTTGIQKVRLRVTDNNGFTNAVTKEVDIGRSFTSAMPTLTLVPSGTAFTGLAEVTASFTGANGKSFYPFGLVGTWSGAVQGTSTSGVTRSGARFTSPPVSSKTACLTFTIDRATGLDPQTGKTISYFPKTPLKASNCAQQATR